MNISQINGGSFKVLVITICPRSSGPFYIVTYYIKWVNTSWTYSMVIYIRTNWS